jgi:hypothetical protein
MKIKYPDGLANAASSIGLDIGRNATFDPSQGLRKLYAKTTAPQTYQQIFAPVRDSRFGVDARTANFLAEDPKERAKPLPLPKVLPPKMTPEQKAEQVYSSLWAMREKIRRSTTVSNRGKLVDTLDARIAREFKSYPKILKKFDTAKRNILREESNALALRNAEMKRKQAISNAEALALSNATAERMKRENPAGIDWGLLPAGAALIGAGAAIIVTGGAAGAAIGAAGAAGTIPAAVGAITAADKLVSAIESGKDAINSPKAEVAKKVVETVKIMAESGDENAKKNLELIAGAVEQRAISGAAPGIPQELTDTAKKVLSDPLKNVVSYAIPPGSLDGAAGITALATADRLLGDLSITNAQDIIMNTQALAAMGDEASMRGAAVISAAAQARIKVGAKPGKAIIPIDTAAKAATVNDAAKKTVKVTTPAELEGLMANAENKGWFTKLLIWLGIKDS